MLFGKAVKIETVQLVTTKVRDYVTLESMWNDL